MDDLFDELACPDCGGRVGATKPGVKACTCFKKEAPKPSRSRVLTELDRQEAQIEAAASSGATQQAPASADRPSASMPASPPGGALAKNAPKLCRVCGKDLSGKSRLKDEQGYLCKPCSDAEDAKTANLIACPECNRKLKPSGFVGYRGTLICKSCHVHHLENDKLKVAKVDLVHHKEEEKSKVKRLLLLLLAMSVLMVFSILSLIR